MEHEFDRQIAIERVGDAGASGGAGARYAADLRPAGWWAAGVNGGYLLAVLGNALRAAPARQAGPARRSAPTTSRRRRPARPRSRTRALRDGGSVATVAADLRQDDDAPDHRARDVRRPRPRSPTTSAPPPTSRTCRRREECVRDRRWRRRSSARSAPLLRPLRHAASTRPRRLGGRAAERTGRSRRWFRLDDGREPDPLSLLMVVDALPPVTFELGMLGLGADARADRHVRARPAPGWLKVRARDPQPGRRDVRGGLRGLGLRRAPGRAEPAAGAPATAGAAPGGPDPDRAQLAEPGPLHREDPAAGLGCSVTDQSRSVRGPAGEVLGAHRRGPAVAPERAGSPAGRRTPSPASTVRASAVRYRARARSRRPASTHRPRRAAGGRSGRRRPRRATASRGRAGTARAAGSGCRAPYSPTTSSGGEAARSRDRNE